MVPLVTVDYLLRHDCLAYGVRTFVLVMGLAPDLSHTFVLNVYQIFRVVVSSCLNESGGALGRSVELQERAVDARRENSLRGFSSVHFKRYHSISAYLAKLGSNGELGQIGVDLRLKSLVLA